MKKENYGKSLESLNLNSIKFETIDEFIDSIERGKEVGFKYSEKEYFVCYLDVGYVISQVNPEKDEKIYSTSKEVLGYSIEGKELKDIIVGAEITWRNV